MTKAKGTVIDSDHEIEEFLQEYIVEKVTSGYEASTTVIKDGVSEIAEIIKSIKNSSNATNQDISVLIKNDDAMLGDIDGIVESINKMIKRIEEFKQLCIKNIMDEDMIKNMSPDELRLIQLSLELVQDCTEIMGEQTRLLESMSLTIELLGKKEGVVH